MNIEQTIKDIDFIKEDFQEAKERIAALEQELAELRMMNPDNAVQMDINRTRFQRAISELDQCLTVHAKLNDEHEKVKGDLAEAQKDKDYWIGQCTRCSDDNVALSKLRNTADKERDQLRQVLDEAGITVEITDTGIRWSMK